MAIPQGFFQPGEDAGSDPDASETEYGYIDQYRVVYTHFHDIWSAHSPDLRGVFAGGKTRRQAGQRMSEAIAFHLEGLAIDARGQAAANA